MRLATGCAWVTAKALCGNRVSDTTLAGRRSERVAAGVFDKLADEALNAFDRIIGLDLSECAIDASTVCRPQRHTLWVVDRRRQPSRQHLGASHP